ncbi:hypothetical protein Vi05172_g8249 [Venturia inaequalis]|nr:hypothetical protein Vi05172_g8249 [Venturia inaequalis]
MKSLQLLLIFILAASSASAKKHRLCCCAGFDACGLFSCEKDSTQSVIRDSNGKFVGSTRSWDKDQGSPIGGLTNWLYSSDDHDDSWVGGDEIRTQSPSSRTRVAE